MVTIYKTNSMKNASEYVMRLISRVDRRDLSVMHTVIVPDRASLEAERQLLKATGGSFNAQVRTFRRLAADVLPKYDYLSKQAGVMALGSIISDNRDKLVTYTKGLDTAGFVADVYDTISMMKYCRISPEQLLNKDLPRSVQNKAHDVALLYRAYCDYTADRFVDSADKMDLLAENARNSEIIAKSYFYIYDFDNLSVQELAVVEQLIKYSRGVTVACCASDDSSDRHLYLNDIYDGVTAVCRRCAVTPAIEQGESYSNRYVEQIGRNLYRYGKVTPIPSDNFAEVYRGATRVQEVYALACRIQNYVRSGGRYRDVYAVTSDVNKYYNAVSTVFAEFGIPYFCDRQFALSAHPYARFVLDYLTLCRNNGKLSSVLPFVKNHLFCQTADEQQRDDVYLFENYCLKYNVSYRYDAFKLGVTEPYFARADRFRARFNQLYKTVAVPPLGTVENYVQIARDLIDCVNLNDLNDKFGSEQAKRGFDFESKVTSQAAEKFEQVLNQAVNVLGGRHVKLDEFIKILTMGVEAVKISVLPVKNDCVIFANMAKARKHDVKFLALLGANYGAMPIVKKDCKLLSDANLKDLASCGINVEPQIFTENKRERFSLFQLLQEPTDRLYVSYSETDGGDALVPSRFVTELFGMFTSNGKPLAPTDTADEEVYTYKQALSKVVLNTRKIKDGQVVKMPAYSVLSRKFAVDTAKYEFTKSGKDVKVLRGDELYLKNARTSVSQLTDFFKCPYRFYLQYGLNVKPRPVAQLQTADSGNILHAVLENYVRGLDVNETDAETEAKAKECFEQAISDDFYKGLKSDAQMQEDLEQLQMESVRLCLVVKEQLLTSDFTNLQTEMAFGIDDTCPPVEVEFKGGKFNLVGKIDRVDVYGNRFIVIDYKSGAGAAHYGEKDLYLGHKMQLLVYVKAVLNLNKDLRPAGFYYFNVHNNFSKVGEEKVYFYNGRTLDDPEVALALDKKLALGKSVKLGLKLKENGELEKRGGALLTDEQFDNQVEYAFQLISKAGELMQQGYAAVSPYEGACEYCDYKDVCGFNDVYVYEARKTNEVITKKTIDKTVEK